MGEGGDVMKLNLQNEDGQFVLYKDNIIQACMSVWR